MGGQSGQLLTQVLAEKNAAAAALVRRIMTCPPSFR